jgi:hypothetical protein
MPVGRIPRAPDDRRGVPVFLATPFFRALPCDAPPMGRDGRAVFFLIWPFGGIAWCSAAWAPGVRSQAVADGGRWAHAPVAGERA